MTFRSYVFKLKSLGFQVQGLGRGLWCPLLLVPSLRFGTVLVSSFKVQGAQSSQFCCTCAASEKTQTEPSGIRAVELSLMLRRWGVQFGDHGL